MRPLGVVLCGGESSRMGRDKGLMVKDGETWAGRAHALLGTLCERVVYSIHPRQMSAYTVAIGDADLVPDSAEFSGMGPLGGLLSVHEKFPHDDIFLLACDMIFADAESLRPLLSSCAEIAAYRSGELFEPLCAFYTAGALGKITNLLKEGKISASLQKILRLAELQVMAIQVSDGAFLKSQNLPYE